MPFSGSGRRRALKLLLSISPIILLGVAAAGGVAVTSNNYSDRAGVYLRPYYEDANATMTGCSAPCLSADTESSGDTQTAGSFTLPAAASMYLWSPQFSSQTSIPAGSFSFQLFADPPPPTLDGSASGSWSSGTSLALGPLSTVSAGDVIILSIVTSGLTTVNVSSISDSLAEITWQASPRAVTSFCTGVQNSSLIEWYGIAYSAISSDVVTVQLSSAPISASGIAFGVAGADTVTPFDPNTVLPTYGYSCGATASFPSIGDVSTDSDNDFIFSLFGGYTSISEEAGTIGNVTSALITTIAGVGDSGAAEYLSENTTQSTSVSCEYGVPTTYYGILCDALMPARQSITVSYETTDSTGTVQSTMASNTPATITDLHSSVSIPSGSGIIPASGYVVLIITDPSTVPLRVFWGSSHPTNFQVTFSYQP